MNRQELERYIVETYAVQAEFPWATYPQYTVFRHPHNQKWFALILNVPKQKLGLSEEGSLDILNVKCDPLMIGSFRQDPRIYPAYHMSKANWISIDFDGDTDDQKIKILLDMSFELTAPPRGKRRKP